MNIILMILGVAVVYFLVVTIYRKNWNKNLDMEVTFQDRQVVRGDYTNLILMVSNAKKLPLPVINTKFQLHKSLYFTDKDTNSNITDKTYRNDVFSLGSNQRITRKVPVRCMKRGVFKLENLEIVFNGIFMDEVNVSKKEINSFITVYPKAYDVSQLGIVNNRLEGNLTKRKYLFEDKFAHRGIREYNFNDNLKLVNWKASAKMGRLMVNEYDETMSRNICILLNLEKDREIESEQIYESSIEVASGFANSLLSKGINVALISNGCDVDNKISVNVNFGQGIAHLRSINTSLARVDTALDNEEFCNLLSRNKTENNVIYIIISANRQQIVVDKINENFKNDTDSIWVVPHFKGEEVKIDTNLTVLNLEIEQKSGGMI